MFNIKWFGHAMWQITTDKLSIILDPFSDIGYPVPKDLTPDIVISSHEHFDHSNFKMFTSPYKKITQIGTYHLDEIKVKLIEVSHGKLENKNLGDTYMIIIYLNNHTIVHCGDIGAIPNKDTLDYLKDADILFVPVGGHYTIDAATAKELIELTTPKVVFPMHYKTEVSKIDGIAGIEPFLALFPETEIVNSDQITIDTTKLKKNKTRLITLDFPRQNTSGIEAKI